MIAKLPDFIGCLIGQCVGDALGLVVEGQPSSVCSIYVNEYIDHLKIPKHLSGRYEFGQYSDDSQLAREMLQSYVSRGNFDPEAYAKRIAAIFRENRIVGRGIATDQAALRLIQGVSWKNAGTPAPSAGNGTAMRVAPIGLMFYQDNQSLQKFAHLQGYITHQDPRCSAGSIIIAGAIAIVLQSKQIDIKQFINNLVVWAKPVNLLFAKELDALQKWISLPYEEALDIISVCGNPDRTDGWNRISPYVIPSVIWSLYSFLKTPNNYMETIKTAIRCGGDVDTTAAMAGAISGAFNGIDEIPKTYAQSLTDQGTWNYKELYQLAKDTYQVVHSENSDK
jgi:ADP-ribosylglycohydrolase